MIRAISRFVSAVLFPLLFAAALPAAVHELVVAGGRVLDPQTGLDGIRHLGIDEGRISVISTTPLMGHEVIDATGLVVAPGFIDLHQHAWDDESIRLKALDGVTSILELEVGTADVVGWYREREGVSRLHHGVSVGHIPVRMAVMGDEAGFLPANNSRSSTGTATPEQIAAMADRIAQGLDAGAVAVGFGFAYTPGATETELLAMLRVAGAKKVSCHVHLRSFLYGGAPTAAMDAARLAATAGAPLHIVHLQASAKASTPDLLRLVDLWQAEGKDVSAEVYPWTAGMTEIKSAIFDEGWQQRLGIDYHALQWGATGERLTEASFARYREQGGLVIVHSNTEAAVALAVNHPQMMIASDGLKGHPRNAGTYARVLGRYVRGGEGLALMDAIRKMTLLPAQRLEGWVPEMKRKGRVQVDCAADLTLFRLETVQERATFEEPLHPSGGIPWVIVAGTPVVRNGELDESVRPGKSLRADLAAAVKAR